jgi:uncharacterized membrane protein
MLVRAAMNRKTTIFAIVGAILLLASFVLGWRAFGTTFSGPISAIVCLVAAITTFISALSFIALALPGFRNLQSTPLMKSLGTVILMIGVSVSLYAAVAFFAMNDLPPNTDDSRLPSLYLLFAGMLVMFVGTAVRSFRLRR